MPDTCTRHPDATLIGHTCADCACPGPCTKRARNAYEAYDQAVIRHGYKMELYADAIGRHQAALNVWRIPLTLPVSPVQPTPPEKPTAPITLGDPVWDSRCARTIRSALAELDDTAALLQATVDGHRPAKTGPNARAALDGRAIVETLDELYGALVEVEDQWREFRGHPARPHRARGGHARRLSIGFLLDELDNILLHPGSVAFGVAALAWQRRLRMLTKSDPTSKASPIRCPRCSERQVSRRDDGYFECLCGRLLNQVEYDREYSSQADEHDHAQQEVGAS